MSYILDALKRAESERSRGAIPNIHVQPDPVAAQTGSRPSARRVGIGAIVLVIALAAGGAWWAGSGPADLPPPPSGQVAVLPGSAQIAPVPAPPAPSVQPAPMSVPTPAAPVQIEPSIMPTRTPPMAAIVPAVTTPSASPRPRTSVALPGASGQTVLPAESPRPDAPATPSGASDERVYSLKELPDDIRNSLPALAVGGATYSENAASRMLIVNGNLFHEGDKLTPEVTLQQIKLRTAVLGFRGYRYFINY